MSNSQKASPADRWISVSMCRRTPETGRFRACRECAVVTMLALAAPGCAMLSNPFRDELAGSTPATTPSGVGVRAAKVSRVAPQRRFQPVETGPSECRVTHAPLYFEDPSEVEGSEDGTFAWTGEDYWNFLAWRGRFLVNLVLFPVNFIETPMWTLMTSDGELAPRGPFQERHDAARADRSTRTPAESQGGNGVEPGDEALSTAG